MNPMKDGMKAKGDGGFMCDGLLIKAWQGHEGDEGILDKTFCK